MNRLSFGLVTALVIAALGVGGWFWWQQRSTPPDAAEAEPAAAVAPPEAKPAAPGPAEPAIRHPIEALPAATADAAASATALPPFDRADAYVTEALTGLLGRQAVVSFLQVDGFARRVVATVDNLARSHAAPRLWPVTPAPGRFTVDAAGGKPVVGAANAQRYAPFVRFVESVDTGRAVALYVRLYPLFQKAYEELGYPGRYFNDRLVEVIDHLLGTPSATGPLKVELTRVKGPVEPVRPWVRYEFSDPALEALSPGQKMLLRMGPANAERLKAKLADIRRQVAVAR